MSHQTDLVRVSQVGRVDQKRPQEIRRPSMYLCGVDETSRLAGTTSGVPGPGIQGATKKGLRNSGGLRCISAGSTRLPPTSRGTTSGVPGPGIQGQPKKASGTPEAFGVSLRGRRDFPARRDNFRRARPRHPGGNQKRPQEIRRPSVCLCGVDETRTRNFRRDRPVL